MRTKYSVAARFITIAVFVIYAAFFLTEIPHVYEGFLNEKQFDKKLNVDLLCDEVERFEDENKRLEILTRVITKLDSSDDTIAGVYDRDFKLLSGRTPVTGMVPFDPSDYPELANTVLLLPKGDLSVWYSMPGAHPPHSVKVYFRWVGDAVVVLGTSKYTVGYRLDEAINNITGGAWVLVAVSVAGGLVTMLMERKRYK